MENKIVYLKTYIITIVVLIILAIAGIGGTVYYYETKIDDMKKTQTNETEGPNNTDITIVQPNNTSVDNVLVK